MSELKAISGHEIREDIDYNTRGIDPEDKEWRNYGKELCDTLYYRKSEADKVIAEKDKEIARLDDLAHAHNIELLRKENVIADLEESHKKEVGQLLILNREQANAANRLRDNMEQTIRRQKYKRCLAMAQEWRNYATFCGMQSSYHNNRGFGKTAEHYSRKEIHAWKCVKRWLKIAEKFKTNSTISRKEATNALQR